MASFLARLRSAFAAGGLSRPAMIGALSGAVAIALIAAGLFIFNDDDAEEIALPDATPTVEPSTSPSPSASASATPRGASSAEARVETAPPATAAPTDDVGVPDATPEPTPQDGGSTLSPKRIAYSTASFSTGERVQAVDPDGSDHQIVRPGFTPSWSPDKDRIAFSSRGSGTVPHVYTANADGSGAKKISTTDDGLFPAWSPDGKKIAFITIRHELIVMDAAGSNPKTVHSQSTVEPYQPAWSPDGDQIAFFGKSGSDTGIYVIDADGTGLHRIIEGSLGPPDWSPDNKKLLLSGNNEVLTINIDGTGRQTVRKHTGAVAAAWSADGSEIAFLTRTESSGSIYTMAADGSNIRRVRSVAEGDDLDW